MNKFLTFAGQQPLYLGDIDFMQDAVAGALKNLVVALTGSSEGNAILSGVEVSYSAGTLSWTAGIVSVAGEILPIAAGDMAGSESSDLYVKIVSELSGERTFKDGQSHECWEKRSATLTTSSTAYMLSDFASLSANSDASLYSFDGVTNINDNYARLANCGGLWVLMISQPAMENASRTFFDGYISGLSDKVLNTFQASNRVPTSVFAKLLVSNYPGGNDYSEMPVIVQFIADGDRLHITVGFISATEQKTNYRGMLQVMLPRFSNLKIPGRV